MFQINQASSSLIILAIHLPLFLQFHIYPQFGMVHFFDTCFICFLFPHGHIDALAQIDPLGSLLQILTSFGTHLPFLELFFYVQHILFLHFFKVQFSAQYNFSLVYDKPYCMVLHLETYSPPNLFSFICSSPRICSLVTAAKLSAYLTIFLL